ncbi:hypothetical protein JY651_42710 [Pyxidicoccus parkwayensis]|uniref:Secreted protein n=1 Tax=Pyxidicoccus parkwayensis TaxID=2813578 RepID=A0ABX7NWP1_9BACT|nr:hypothetical protein [Pyxidicoccus parkwaysis]QSQ21796.1 hypothetical protein JY651_42710 [Pyxidicoccus parkwaysis]
MKTLLPAVIGVALLVPPSSAEACGVFEESPIQVHTTHPDRPFDTFAAGHLGVLREWYRHMYLAYAYRTMMGVPTTADEQQHLVAMWSVRQGDKPLVAESDAMKHWLDARAQVAPAPPAAMPRAVEEQDYASYARIQSDAFLKAADTARALAREWKEHPALVEEWVRNQDTVFGPCAGLPPLDAKLDEGLKPAQKARRQAEHDYQAAAASFYCGDYDSAASAFQDISQSKDSPYQALGAYLVARSRVRQALFSRKETSFLSEPSTAPEFLGRLAEADKLLDGVLANPKWAQVHGPARRLRSLVRSRIQPDTWGCELLSRVLQPGTGSSLGAELADLDLLGWRAERCTNLPAPAAELAEWLVTTREQASPEYIDEEAARKAYGVAVARWKKTAHVPWLVTALLKARVDSPGLDALLADAAKVAPTSPAGVTVAYRSAHLLRERGDLKAAQARLAAAPLELTKDQVSTDNLLRQERFAAARSWEELFRNSTRRQAGVSSPENFSDAMDTPPDARPVSFGEEVLPVLEPRVTAQRMAELAASDSLSPALRRWVSWTALAKAMVVGDDEALRATAKSLAKTEPAAKEELLAIDAKPTPEERRFEAQVLLMGLPTVSPRLEPYPRIVSADPKFDLTLDVAGAKNWWCAPKAGEPVKPFPFASEAEQQAAASEWKTLIDAGDSVPYFARVALDWAKAHPEDPRSPKALFRVVRASRRGCRQGTAEAKEAFRYLHEHYKTSPWAKKATRVY